MNTFLSEKDLELKAQFERFAQEQLAPVAEALESRQANLRYFLKKAAQAGLFAVTVPQEYGGRGGSFLHAVLLAESMAVYNPGFSLTLAAQVTVIELIKRFGTDSQRSKYLPLLAQGELLGTFAHFEDESQEPFADTATEIKGQGARKTISGKKKLVVNGRIAGLVIILAVQKLAEGNDFGLWIGQVGNDHAIRVLEQTPFIGLRSAFLDEVEFLDYSIQSDQRLGAGEGQDLKKLNSESQQQFELALSVTKTMLAASAVGLSENLLVKAGTYARDEKRFGGPASQSEAVQWRLADLAVDSSAGRLLTYRAAWSKDDDEEQFIKYAAMCKSFTAKMARIHSAEAMQILGLFAKACETDLERSYRDAKMLELCGGTNDEEKVLLGRELGI